MKCVILIEETLPIGVISNISAILGISLGKKMPEIVGDDVVDKNGNLHLGIIEIPIPILKTNSQTINEIRLKLYQTNDSDLTVIDFTDLAQSCKTYDEFVDKMKEEKELNYIGLAIYGNQKKINKLTGNMPLLR